MRTGQNSPNLGITSLYMGSFSPLHLNHVKVVEAALNTPICDQLILIPNASKPSKPNLPALPIRMEMMSILLAEILSEANAARVKVASCDRTFDAQYCLSVNLGNHRQEKLHKISSQEGLLPFIEQSINEGISTLPKDLINSHHDVFIRADHSASVEPFKQKAEQIGLSYTLHPAPEEAPLSSTKIRGWLKEGSSRSIDALKEIYPQKALAFLFQHIEAFTK